MPRVFISYSHDCPLHRRRIHALADQLRADGIEAWIDEYAQDPDEGWPAWMRSQVAQADRVLLVFTETYARRFLGAEAQGIGLGVTFEGVLATQALYESGARNAKFRPVVFTEEDAQFIPSELRRFNRYRVDTPDHYQNLLRWLHEAPRIVAPKVGPKPPLPPETPPPSKPVERNRRDLLNDVKGEVANRLAQSLHSAMLINLQKEKQPQQVSRTGDREVTIPHQPSSPLPPGTQIIDVFDQDAGRLLVLGAPGAGKTTTLLQLAKELIARAQTDAGTPMPVLLNLSSWKDDGQPLVRWVEAELKSKYGVRKDIGRRWLHDRCLLPLLDALDELEPTRQEQCVHAINQFQNDPDYRPDHLVVCCRLAEYQNCNTKLQLNGAIYLQPLTDEQVCNYLASAKHPELWNQIQTDAELLELARSPLLLSMLTLAYETRSIQEWRNLTQERHQYLFDVYIERMLSRQIERQEYAKERTLHWLAWLAQRLRERAQTDLVIEKLQPTWLQSLTPKWIYRIAVVLLVVLVFGMFQLLIYLTLPLVPKGRLMLAFEEKLRESMGRDLLPIVDSYVFAILGLIAGLIVGLMPAIRPIETLQWSGTRAWSRMVLGLRRWSGLKYAAYVGLIAGQVGWPIAYLSLKFSFSDAFPLWSRVGQIAGVVSGLICAVAVLLITRPSVLLTCWPRDWVAVRWADSLISALTVGLCFGLSFDLLIGVLGGLSVGFIAGLSYGLRDRPVFRMADALMVGLIGGLISGLVLWILDAMLFKVLRVGLSTWIGLWLCGWLGAGATAGLVACLIAKLRKTTQPVETLPGSGKAAWNWLARRWRQWLICGVVAAAVSSVSLVLLMGWGQIRVFQAIYIVSFCLGWGVVYALVGLFLTALMAALLGAVFGGVPGALLGLLSGGLTGPEIERRTVPNQGIRQSAGNVWVFALVGGLTLGTIWGLLNLSFAVLVTGVIPEASDWLRLQLSGVLFLGLLSGLVPGAACIQHFALRFILWCRGVTPWNYARFLNYATERMLLQRVGGRYRFIHELLREHFATMEPKRVES
jgi:DNA polymerase III delta prime subunit